MEIEERKEIQMHEKCGYVWLTTDRHVCDRIKGHSGNHRCEVCDAVVPSEGE